MNVKEYLTKHYNKYKRDGTVMVVDYNNHRLWTFNPSWEDYAEGISMYGRLIVDYVYVRDECGEKEYRIKTFKENNEVELPI